MNKDRKRRGKTTAKRTLDRKEVSVDWNSTSTTKSSQFSRRLKLTSASLRLTHIPTGTVVTGQVPEGHYSKTEMQELKQELNEELFVKLEAKVL